MTNRSYCAYCGRLRRRCRCDQPDSAIARFLERGGRSYQPLTCDRPPKWAVPPQVKRRERLALQKRYAEWYWALAARHGETCGNCGVTADLALDHILPIAKGGLSRLDNLQLLCAACNRIKGKLMIDCRPLKHRG